MAAFTARRGGALRRLRLALCLALAQPALAQPTAAEPAAEPAATEPTAAEPSAAEPTAAEPAAAEPAAAEPAARLAPAESFCALERDGATALPLTTLTALGPQATSPEPQTILWVNLWASWCKPCIEELPLLARWQTKLARLGLPYRLVLLSLDSTQAQAERALAQMDLDDDLRDTLRASAYWLASPQRAAFFEAAEQPSIDFLPMQLLADPQQRVRCAHEGAVREAHYGAALLRLDQLHRRAAAGAEAAPPEAPSTPGGAPTLPPSTSQPAQSPP